MHPLVYLYSGVVKDPVTEGYVFTKELPHASAPLKQSNDGLSSYPWAQLHV